VNVMRCLGFVCGRGPCWQQWTRDHKRRRTR